MSNVLEKIDYIFDAEYKKWLTELKRRFRQSQIKASVKVNQELMRFYWLLGHDMVRMKSESKWGSKFYEALSRDLKEMFSESKGFSPRNLYYMKQFYLLFPEKEITPQVGAQLENENLLQDAAKLKDQEISPKNSQEINNKQIMPQVAAKLDNKITLQPVAQFNSEVHPEVMEEFDKQENSSKIRQEIGNGEIMPQDGAKLDNQITQQVVAQLENEIIPQVGEEIFNIPWVHMRIIIDKSKMNTDKAIFFIKEIIKNNWSRNVLRNFLDTNLYERQGKAITNFEYRLPKENSGLAQEITKDPYNFDFLSISKDYNEKELKNALISNIQRFLLELGTGFAYMGEEVRINIGNTEEKMDMLFYNTKVHAYVVVEVKVGEFKPNDIGQLGTYVVAVDHVLKSDKDEKTIGILICRNKNEILARYALESSSEPLGISTYELSKQLPEEYKSSLPSIEELEDKLNNK